MTEDIGTAISRAAGGVDAPPHLRERIDRSRPPRLRLAVTAGLLGTAAVLWGVLGPGTPTVTEVAAAGLHAPERSAPAARAYESGYRAIGSRTDRVGTRRSVTVIYRRGTAGVHYSIVDGKPLELPGTRRVRAGGKTLALDRDGAVNLVAWIQDGKTCVLASRAVGLDGLVRFASRA